MGYVYTPDAVMIVVCDGMGGHLHGEIASQYVIEYAARVFRLRAKTKLDDPATFLRETIIAAHLGINEYARINNLKETPRTTCVIAIIQNGNLWWANVGDSRAYLVRDTQLVCRTRDHSHVQNLIDKNAITSEEAAVHPDRHKIYNCIGQHNLPQIDISAPERLLVGDVILLCTDGLWGPIDETLLCATLSRSDVSVSLPMLMNMAESFSGRECDNVSAVAFGWLDPQQAIKKPDPDSIYIVAESRTINDDDVAIAVAMIKGAIHRGGKAD